MLNPALKLNEKLFDENVETEAIRDGFGKGLVELGEKNKDVICLTADLGESTKTTEFAKKFPNRFIECGVAEQNMVAIAAGLADSGKIAFTTSYSVFSPGKNWETVRTTIAYTNANVKIAGHHAGIITGPDGATHQATEDISSVRAWPNMKIFSPCDSIEAKKATVVSGQTQGPFYLRFVREKTPIITTQQTPFNLNKIEIFWTPPAGGQNPKVVIFATGHMVYQALLAAKKLEKEIEVLVANVSTLKPIDKKTVVELAKRIGKVVTCEDHQVAGGLGSIIAEVLASEFPAPIEFVGLKDIFGESGSPKELLEKYGLTKDWIIKAVKRVLER
jgi:transketolase